MTDVSILWKRIDTPGHEACTLRDQGDGRRLDGTAVFLHECRPARLNYAVVCDHEWRAKRGTINGSIGTDPVDIEIVRRPDGEWTRNGTIVEGLAAYVDLNLGFSPSTNLCQIRRLDLAIGEAADCPVAWLDLSTTTLDVLAQRYERRSELNYWYEAPRFGYAAVLEVDKHGLVRHYPELWLAIGNSR